jgi:ABC-type uncharacterized transport system substrate-binding protein
LTAQAIRLISFDPLILANPLRTIVNNLIVGFFLFLLSTAGSTALGAEVGVLYPALREPYNKVFDTIIEGVEQQIGQTVDRYALNKDYNATELGRRIKKQNRVILALGVRGLKAAEKINPDMPVVIGAVFPSASRSVKINHSGIALVPDPELLFRQLKSIAPRIRTVSVVYNPHVNRSLIERAEQAAKSLGLTLEARPADDIRSAALIYKQILDSMNSRDNAIWLLQDATTVDSDTVLPLLLEEAWKRSLIVFSSNLVHAKRGALFSMYPNNLEMGRALGRLTEAALRTSAISDPGITVLRALKVAVNVRTAKHLGINFSKRDEQSFDLIFPTP